MERAYKHYYFIIRGDYYVISDDNYNTTEFVNADGDIITLDKIYNDIVKLSIIPVLENHKMNLETGFISQEEYDNFIEEAQEYAVIVK